LAWGLGALASLESRWRRARALRLATAGLWARARVGVAWRMLHAFNNGRRCRRAPLECGLFAFAGGAAARGGARGGVRRMGAGGGGRGVGPGGAEGGAAAGVGDGAVRVAMAAVCAWVSAVWARRGRRRRRRRAHSRLGGAARRRRVSGPGSCGPGETRMDSDAGGRPGGCGPWARAVRRDSDGGGGGGLSDLGSGIQACGGIQNTVLCMLFI
jgi:hypothetical protein